MVILDLGKLIDLILLIVIILFLSISYQIHIIKNKINEKKCKNQIKIASKIIDEFEDFLHKNNIKIPCMDREGNDDEACIYGTEYYNLENSIIDILNNN